MAHCSFSFLMELYKAWEGRNKSGRYRSLGEANHVPHARALSPPS